MNFECEPWVKLYVRDTVNVLMLSWKARGLFWSLLRVVDEAGVLALENHGPRALVAKLHIPPGEWDEAQTLLDELLRDGCVQVVKEGEKHYLVIPKFVDAQASRVSGPAARKRRQRARAKAYEAREALIRAQESSEMSMSRSETSMSRSVTETTGDVTSGVGLSREMSTTIEVDLDLEIDQQTPLSGGPGGDVDSRTWIATETEAPLSMTDTPSPALAGGSSEGDVDSRMTETRPPLSMTGTPSSTRVEEQSGLTSQSRSGRSGVCPAAKPKPKPKPRKHRLPDDWQPSPEMVRWAAGAKGVRLEAEVVEVQAEAFRDYWLNATRNALKVDWDAAFRNWLRKHRERNRWLPEADPPPDPKLVAEREARRQARYAAEDAELSRIAAEARAREAERTEAEQALNARLREYTQRTMRELLAEIELEEAGE